MGPATAAGRAAVRFNALGHGLRASQVLLPDEQEADLLAFRSELFNALEPCGAVEELLADRTTWVAWRLRRSLRVEAGLLDAIKSGPLALLGDNESPLVVAFRGDALGLLSRYEQGLERSLLALLRELRALKASRRSGTTATLDLPEGADNAEPETVRQDEG